MAAIGELEARSREAAPGRRRRLVRPPRLPRAAEVDPARRRRPAELLVGVGEHAVRLWEASSRAPCSSAGTRSTVPTYRHEALAGLPVGARVRRRRCSSSSTWPAARRGDGVRVAKADGYEADDFLAAASPSRRRAAARRSSRAATATRSSSSSERTTILQPQKGVERARADRPGRGARALRRRPEQVPDFIALRGDPSDKIPGARGVGAKTAASLLAQYGTLEAALAAGRFAAEADALRLYRHIATMDARAPLPALEDSSPTGRRRRARATSWARTARGRLEEARRAPDQPGARAPAPDRAHPERQERLASCSAARRSSGAATRGADSPRCHTAELPRDAPATVDRPDAARRRTRSPRRRPGRPPCSPQGSRSRRSTAAASRSSGRRATTRSPTARWASASSTTSRSRRATRRRSSDSSASRSSTSTSTTATAPRRSSADDDTVLFVSLHQWPFYPGTGGPDTARDDAERAAAGRLGRRRVPARVRAGRRAGGRARSRPTSLLVSAGFDAHEDDPLAQMSVTEDGFRELARRCAAARAARRRRARRRLQPRDAAAARRGGARGLPLVER